MSTPGIPYVYSNWCYMDALDEHILKDGEILEITWADGHVTQEKIVVEEKSEPYQDMGHTNYMSVTKAFVLVDTRGTKAKIRLVEAKVQKAVRVGG